ncbi:hypothetical protein ABCR94_01095 [Streptomyces sp. 21So2-11]|uniref:hypothetical protein n=1 Tax=Streptomyces sp. 21So2-11 TaxID=3144408 RepID=UPI0032195669
MTQSGQGDESRLPAAQPPAHEGVVLPADGSGPWIPGAAASGEQATPTGGQPWGQPWGPQSEPAQQQPPQGQLPQQPGRQAPRPMEPLQQVPQVPQGQYGQQTQQAQYGQQGQHGQHEAQGQLPPQQQMPQQGQGPMPGQQVPQHAQHQMQPYPGQSPPPQAQQPYQQPQSQQQPQYPGQAWGQQYPPAHEQQPPAYSQDQGQDQGQGRPQAYAQPLPPENAGAGGDADATQYIAAYVPPVAPVGPGALPPENPAESTQFLGYRQDMPATPAPMAGADAESTQFLPPVPAGQSPPTPPPGAPFGIRPGAPEDRQPPAEFDSLFRADAAPEAPDSTQQMPRFEAQQQAGQGQPGHQAPGQPQFGQPPQGRAARRNAAAHGAPAAQAAPTAYSEPAAPRRRSSPAPLIAAVVVGCAIVGLGAGWLMSGGDEEKSKGDQPVAAASTPGDANSPKAAEDPARPQAESLDALLADSNNSRESVISAVAAIRTCENLPKAASDLRAAAKQRNGLVTRLQGLTIDKLPDHGQLSSSLTTAWKASAAADNHYAVWANQVGGKKGCKKGHARSTPQQAAGNRESGNASQAKKEAVGMWNTIAEKHGLTKRDATQL